MLVRINLFIWLCPSSLIFPRPLLDLCGQGYAFYQPLRVRQREIQTAEGVGAWRRDEIETDRADEVEEGGAEIKLNTK